MNVSRNYFWGGDMNVYTNFFYIIRTGTKEGVEDKKIKTAKKFECFNYLIF